ncbi:sensor histidine kinase [Corynebacterium ciconiae]|uniref:sensor histidine kinase n=1 Tax=Corynebacterium ciconiae TaxID=227319 RepID=UPI00035C6EB5|nr:histidine kinase [Corynebacterium ciconiae]
MAGLFRRVRSAGSQRDHDAEIRHLIDSRRTIVNAYEVERRRIERDLHDGAQQSFVAAAMALGEAELDPAVEANPQLKALLAQAHRTLDEGLEALRATVRGIHPHTLSDSGLVAAVEELLHSMPLRSSLTCPHPLPTLPEGVLACGYFFVSEALSNIGKYVPEARVDVLITVESNLRISVLDTGSGGARIVPGGGLHGIKERLAAFGGTMELNSPPGGPTQVVANVPLLLHRGESGIVLSAVESAASPTDVGEDR